MRKNYAGLLMIAYKYPPVKAVGSLRNYNISREFARYFDSVRVITTSNRNVLPRQELPGERIAPVYPAQTLDTKTLWQWVKPAGKRGSFSLKQWDSPLMRLLRRIRDSFPMNLLLDEGGPVYIIHACIIGARLIREGRISHIYSSFRPFADHVVAYLLKRRFPKLSWIADFRDLPVDPNMRNALWPRFQDRVYRRMLRRAEAVVTVSEGYARYLGRYGRPVLTLRNGIGDWLQAPPPQNAERACFTITYTGSVYPEFQDAALLFQAICTLLGKGKIDRSRLKLRYLGNDPAIWQAWAARYGLEDMLENDGPVDLHASLAAQQHSNINLLLSWSGPVVSGVLTGKLYEYLHARRPILALVNGSPEPELEAMLEQVNAGIVVYNRPEHAAKVAGFLLSEYRNWALGALSAYTCDPQALKLFTWQSQTRQFFRQLDLLSGGRVQGARRKVQGRPHA